MANTTFTGPVRSQNGFQSVTVSPTTGAVTVNASFGKAAVLGTQSLSGAGAVDIVNTFTALTTTGASQALTLANGTVLDLQGAQDVWRPRQTRMDVVQLLGDKAQVYEIQQAGHALIPEQPEAVANAILTWMAQLTV